MSERSAAIGLASASAGEPPPNASAAPLETKDQVTASRRESAASVRLASRVRFCMKRQHRPRHALVEPGQGRGRRAVDAGDAQDLLDDIGLDLHVRAPGGDENMGPLDAEAQSAEDRLALVARDIDAEEPLHFAIREGDRAPRR